MWCTTTDKFNIVTIFLSVLLSNHVVNKGPIFVREKLFYSEFEFYGLTGKYLRFPEKNQNPNFDDRVDRASSSSLIALQSMKTSKTILHSPSLIVRQFSEVLFQYFTRLHSSPYNHWRRVKQYFTRLHWLYGNLVKYCFNFTHFVYRQFFIIKNMCFRPRSISNIFTTTQFGANYRSSVTL